VAPAVLLLTKAIVWLVGGDGVRWRYSPRLGLL